MSKLLKKRFRLKKEKEICPTDAVWKMRDGKMRELSVSDGKLSVSLLRVKPSEVLQRLL